MMAKSASAGPMPAARGMAASIGLLPRALQALQSGQVEAALTLLGSAAPQDARPAAWHALRGMALMAHEDWHEARASLRQAVADGDRSADTALNLALATSRLAGPEDDGPQRDGPQDDEWEDGPAAARRTIARLERDHPMWYEPPFRLAELLRAAGRTTEAAAAYERALAVAPNRTEALLRLATLHIGCGEPRRAESLLIRCCGVAPQNWEAWDALGLTSCLLGDRPAALAAFRRSHALNPANVNVALRLASTAAACKAAEAELLGFEAANLSDPLQAGALAGRASLLFELGRDDEALQLLEAAAAIDPGSAGLAAFRAERLLRGGRHNEALEAVRAAVVLDPGNRGLRNNLAVALTRSHHYAQALTVLDELATQYGERIDMLCNRANALVCLGRQDEGVAAARQATLLAGDAPGERHLAWRTLANALAYSDGVTAQTLGDVLRRVADTAARPPDDAPARRLIRRAGVGIGHGTGIGSRLRVGLLSATLKTHPVGWLTLAGFENLDPDRFELVCIGQREGTDPMQRRFRAAAAEWHPLADRGLPELAEKVRDLRLDILIDLGGYGDQGMLGECARRLAPVQIKWVGMQNHTTAMPEIDWFITDRWETPPDLAPLYTERLLMMPDGYVCYAPPVHAPAVAPLPALGRGAVTFGCFNNLAKVTPRVVAVWAAIMQDVPASRLVLKTHQLADPTTSRFVEDSFAAHGIAADRLDLRGGSRHRELLGEYGDIDIVLDPFPYSGGLTTCEALWMGVPTLTCPGEIFASRHSASHLCNIGLDDWVVPDLPTYRAEAVRRAGDLRALAALRAELRPRMRASPLCDAPRFGRHLGEALLRAWNAP